MNPQHWNENAKRLFRLGMFGFTALLSAGILSYVFALSLITTALLSLALVTSVELCYQVVFRPKRLIPRLPRDAYSNLTQEEIDAINDLHQRYAHEVDRRSVDVVLEEFKVFLEDAYQKKPVRYNGTAYPLEYQTGLPPEVLKLYHQHPIHSAHRYLFQRPNHFMSRNAPYVDVMGDGHAAKHSQRNKKLLAIMWLAANDERTSLPEGFTKRRQLLKALATPLHELNRLYSDNDDLVGDSPSCPHGANNRLAFHIVAFLNNSPRGQVPDIAPEQRALTQEIIRQRFVARVLAKEGLSDSVFAKMHRLNLKEFDVFERAFDNLINRKDLTQEQQEMMHQLKPSEELINEFIEECQQEFGAERISRDSQLLLYPGGELFTSYEVLIRRWSQDLYYLSQFGVEIRSAIEQCKQQAIEVDEFPNHPPLVHQFNQQQPMALNEPANDEAMDDNKELRNTI